MGHGSVGGWIAPSAIVLPAFVSSFRVTTNQTNLSLKRLLSYHLREPYDKVRARLQISRT